MPLPAAPANPGHVTLLYQALESPYGISVKCPVHPSEAQKYLYTVRRKLADPALECLSFYLSRDIPDELWIVKTGPRL